MTKLLLEVRGGQLHLVRHFKNLTFSSITETFRGTGDGPLRAARIKNEKRKLNLEKVYQVRIHWIANFHTHSVTAGEGVGDGGWKNARTNEKEECTKSRPQEKRNNCIVLTSARIVVNCGKLRDVDSKNFFPNCITHFSDVYDANRFQDLRRCSHPTGNIILIKTLGAIFRTRILDTWVVDQSVFFCIRVLLFILRSDNIPNSLIK